jgi:UrcA family protein
MIQLCNPRRIVPLTMLTALALVADAPPAAAQSIRLAVPAEAGPASQADFARRIASAARALCDSPGLAGLHRNAARRCRAEAIANATRQLRERTALRLAARR